MALPSVVQLNEYASGDLFQLAGDDQVLRGAGTYTQVAEIVGNSILSSVFIRAISAGATLKINYYDTTTGSQDGERFELLGHDLITDSTPALTTFRILVTRIHHRVVAEAIVTGGTVDFSLYATTVSSSASDLDQALIRDGDTFQQTINKALPAATLDDSDGKLYFLRSKQGVLTIEQDFGTPTPLRSDPSEQTVPSSTITLITASVPVGKTWRIRRLECQCRAFGFFEVFVDSLRIAKVNSDAACQNGNFIFDPYDVAIAGEVIEVKYTETHGPAVDVSAVLFTTEQDA